jgi:hypothetical protein
MSDYRFSIIFSIVILDKELQVYDRKMMKKYQQQVAEYERNMTKYQKVVCERVKSAGSGLTLLQYLQMPFC